MKKVILALLICLGLVVIDQEVNIATMLSSFSVEKVDSQASVVVGQNQAITYDEIDFDQAIEEANLVTDLTSISTAELGRSIQNLSYLDQDGQTQTLTMTVWVLKPISLEEQYGLENQISDYMNSLSDQALELNFEGWLNQTELNQWINQQMQAGTYLSAIIFRIDHQLNYTYYPDGRVDVSLKIQKYNHHSEDQEAAVNAYVETVVQEMGWTRNLYSEEELVRQIHDYIIEHAAYATPNDPNYLTAEQGSEEVDTIGGISIHSPYAIVQEGRGVCQAYAALFQKFCDYLEIPCIFVLGQRDNNGLETHAWNKVMIEGQWYNIDLTWDDPIIGQDNNDLISGGERDQYYLKSDASFQIDHQFETGLDFPAPADYEQY